MLLRSKRKLKEVHSDGDRDRKSRRADDPSKSITPNYKEEVLKLLSEDKENQSNHLVFELRMALFVAAARSPVLDVCLVPFPHSLLDDKTWFGIMRQIQGIPALVNIQESTQLPERTWELLNWVFKGTSPGILLEPLVKNMTTQIVQLRRMTGLENLPIPDNSNVFMFKVTPQPKPEFEKAKKKYGSKFAFHGSAVKNFHSILHRGLMSSFNVRSVYGHGTYLSPEIYHSNTYAYPSLGWDHSVFGDTFRCIALAEFALSPDTRDYTRNTTAADEILLPSYICICNNDDHIRVTHLLLYRH